MDDSNHTLVIEWTQEVPPINKQAFVLLIHVMKLIGRTPPLVYDAPCHDLRPHTSTDFFYLKKRMMHAFLFIVFLFPLSSSLGSFELLSAPKKTSRNLKL